MSHQALPKYIASLLHSDAYNHAVGTIKLVETHISWVLLTGAYAYKIKKPVNLGFLDFSSLEKRHFYCQEELRLNARLASSIYLEVVAITGPEQKAMLSGPGKIIEYAVKMHQFPPETQVDRMLESGQLRAEHIDLLARSIADFHLHADIAGDDTPYGEPGSIYTPLQDNFTQLQQLLWDNNIRGQLTTLEQWSRANFKHLQTVFIQRKQAGFIRECHGDLHTGNLVFINSKPVAFDCIEFSPELRWIDIISDAAFLIMDLEYRQHSTYARRFLNTWLEATGDYAALPVLRFYMLYRALVRAKVSAINAAQLSADPATQNTARINTCNYLELAQSCIQADQPVLIINCGLSASGKSTLTLPLVEKLGAIRLRSDVERKRLFKDSVNNHPNTINTGIYSADASQKTYQYLLEQAELIINAGYPVILDAAFLHYQQRSLFQQWALKKNIPFIILLFTARPDTLRQRISQRKQDVSDADRSVLEHQLLNWKPPRKDEQAYTITVDTEAPFNPDELINKIHEVFLKSGQL